MREYKRSTIKSLFASSGNQCAFANCRSPIVNIKNRKILGQICHIRSGIPDGPRYDPTYPTELIDNDRNLVLMCRPHHLKIDKYVESFSPETLEELKAIRERNAHGAPELSDPEIDYFQSKHELLVYENRPVPEILDVRSVHWIGDEKEFVTVDIKNDGKSPLLIESLNILLGGGRGRISEQSKSYKVTGVIRIDYDRRASIPIVSVSTLLISLDFDEKNWKFEKITRDPNLPVDLTQIGYSEREGRAFVVELRYESIFGGRTNVMNACWAVCKRNV